MILYHKKMKIELLGGYTKEELDLRIKKLLQQENFPDIQEMFLKF